MRSRKCNSQGTSKPIIHVPLYSRELKEQGNNSYCLLQQAQSEACSGMYQCQPWASMTGLNCSSDTMGR